MPTRTDEPVDLEAALSGRSPTLAAKDAVYRLARSGTAGAKERLARLIRDGATAPVRRRAALGLSLIAGARPELRQAIEVGEPGVLAAALLSLARVGTAEDLPAMRAAAKRLSGHQANQARFAELLLAHRVGLGADVVPPIPSPVVKAVPAQTRAITGGDQEEAARAWPRFEADASLGFEPDGGRCAVIHCGRRNMLFVPAMHPGSDVRRPRVDHRTLLGGIASYERETGSWHHDLWILSTPVQGGVELQAWTLGGRVCYAGSGDVRGDALAFELWTTESCRLALAHVRGRLAKDGLTVDGTVGDRPASDSRAVLDEVR